MVHGEKNKPKTVKDAIDCALWDAIPELIEQAKKNLESESRGRLLIKIASMLQKVKQFELSLPCLFEALDLLTLNDDHAQIHAMIGRSYREMSDYDHAKTHGEKTIQLNDTLSLLHQPDRKIVACSLYGANPVYCENTVINAQLMPDIYPDWEMMVFHDNTVPAHVLKRLEKLKVTLVSAEDERITHMPGTFWRFLALEIKDADAVIMRDVDSLISHRERVLVEKWLDSQQPFHIVRDWFGQTDLILAGLWGARLGLLSGIRAWIEDYLQQTPTLHATHADQFFLAQHIWPRIKKFALHHSSIYDYPQSEWPSELPKMNQTPTGIIPLGAWLTTQYQVASAGDYMLYIFEGNTPVCWYSMTAGEGFELPKSYHQAIEEGRWRLQIVPYTISHTPSPESAD